MPRAPIRSHRSIWLVALSIAAGGPLAAATPPPNLVGTFSGTYQLSNQTSAETLQLEVERQHGRRLRVSIFAMDQPEFQGRAKLLRDGVSLTLHTKATGRGAARLRGTGDVGNAGTTISGTLILHQRGLEDRAGTFSVFR